MVAASLLALRLSRAVNGIVCGLQNLEGSQTQHMSGLRGMTGRLPESTCAYDLKNHDLIERAIMTTVYVPARMSGGHPVLSLT